MSAQARCSVLGRQPDTLSSESDQAHGRHFYFEEDGLLRRHDYVADIVGGWARGAHFWREFVTVSGLQMASVRHVVARLGQRTTPFVALHAELAIEEGASDPPPQIIRES